MSTGRSVDNAALEAGRQVRQLDSNMPSLVPPVLFVILALLCLGIAYFIGLLSPVLGFIFGMGGVIASGLIASAIKVANPWQRGVVLRLGDLKGIRGPGLFFVIPVIDRVRMLDLRVLTHHIREQEVITRDNVPVTIDSVLFYRVTSPEDAIMKIQDYAFAMAQLAQSALRDVVGGLMLDELLAEREQIAKQVELHVETESREWGLHVTGIRLQDIDMPEELREIMSRQAGAEREKRATIQGRRGQAGRRESGCGGIDHEHQPRRDAASHAANDRRPGTERIEYRAVGGARGDH